MTSAMTARVTGPPLLNLALEVDVRSSGYDAILWISVPGQKINSLELQNAADELRSLDKAAESEIHVFPIKNLPAGRLIYSPTGRLDPDYDDARVFREAAAKGVRRLLKTGVKRPLVVLPSHEEHKRAELVALLSVLNTLYVPLRLRELVPDSHPRIESLSIYAGNLTAPEELIKTASNLYQGISVARDICEGDPERMCAKNIEEYVKNIFKNSSIKISVLENENQLEKEYPLFQAVNRASAQRHKGRIVFLEYEPKETVQETLLLVGKGITYDTGGADLKVNGVMIGMSRDKGGASAVAGFLKLADLVQPKNLKIVGALCLSRNSIGPDAYVSDELIVSRAGVRVRIGNTDAEGRMVMTDVLARMKELAMNAVNPHLYTIATLTGHAVLTVGDNYSIVMDNGVARKRKHAERLLEAGFEIGEPLEITTLRREDFAFNAPQSEVEEVVQANNKPSSQTARGHQIAPAFMVVASGLDKHGSGAEVPLKYTHLDIAGSAGNFPGPATGAPILALANAYIL